MLLTDKYADKIYGIITCYDRMIIQGYIPNWSHADAMTTYLKLKQKSRFPTSQDARDHFDHLFLFPAD